MGNPIILFLLGWESTFPDEFKIQKMVMVAAPFTSSWDLIIVTATYWKEGVQPNFLVNKKYTNGFFSPLFKWIGAIGIDTSKSTNKVDYAVNLFKENSKLMLLVSPEGTRKAVEKWKTGFYHIARLADVPICLGHLDYRKKKAYIGNVFNVTGDFEKCISFIQKECEKVTPKHPERYNKLIY